MKVEECKVGMVIEPDPDDGTGTPFEVGTYVTLDEIMTYDLKCRFVIDNYKIVGVRFDKDGW